MKQDLDFTGQTFGRWEVLGRAPDRGEPSSNRKYKMWRCRCSCESHTIKDVYECHLLRGNSKSCGCLAAEKCGDNFRTHGKSDTRLFGIWTNMRKRCNNPTDPAYKNYGGRGIGICSEWDDYVNFDEWARTHGYKDNLTIDRIDNDKGYSPNNCRWVDYLTQANNTRNNVYISAVGKTQNISAWARELNIPEYLIVYRRSHGWTDEQALFTPILTTGRAVKAIDANGNEIFYESIKKAAEAVGVTPSAISRACKKNNGKSAGFYWEYNSIPLKERKEIA